MLKHRYLKLSSIIILLALSNIACSKQDQIGITAPMPHATISVSESPKIFKKNNENIKEYWSFDDNPLNVSDLGVTFYEIDFPSDNYGSATFSYPNVPSLTINNVSGTSSFFLHEDSQKGMQKARIDFFIPNNRGSYEITQKQAYHHMQKLFKQLEEEGWVYDNFTGSPRLSIKDSYKFATNENGSKIYLDSRYPLTFREFKQLANLQTWLLRYNTEVFLEIDMQYQLEEETNQYYYLIGLKFQPEEIYINGFTHFEDPTDSFEVAFQKYYAKMPMSRLNDETQALEIGLEIQQDQPDYTLPLVLKETGIDTSKFVSIDPYKITYEEFIKRQEAGEDMTPYYENQPETTPEISSQARGRCPADQPCPKSGYWFTQAKSDSRAYFKQGDLMPDYPNNNWGEVIWQFDGEQG